MVYNINHNSNDTIYKKIILFFMILVLVMIVIPFIFPNSNVFIIEHFEYILLGIIVILGILVLFSMLNINHSEKTKEYKRVNKIITFEG
jgi:lipopolysaccharide export LptBFGC system permease protein LptF